jgi:hypothetical protein
MDVIKGYFANGTLPQRGTVCLADAEPFQKRSRRNTIIEKRLLETPGHFGTVPGARRY